MIRQLLTQFIISISALLYRGVWLILVLFVCIALYLNTPFGLKLTVDLIAWLLPGQLHIQKLEGSLLHRIAIEHFTYQNATVNITIDHFDLTWQPSALFSGRLLLSNLISRNINIKLHPTGKTENNAKHENSGTTILSWLTHIDVQHIDIENFELADTAKTLFHFNKLLIEHNETYSLLLATDSGQINGVFTLAWQPNFTWQGELSSQDFNMTTPNAYLPTKINFQLTTQGHLGDDKKITVNLKQATGLYHGYSLQAQGAFNIDKDALKIQQVHATVGDAHLQMNGSLANEWQLNWQLAIPHFQTLFDHSSGSLNSSGHVTGDAASPAIEASVRGKLLQFGEIKIGAINGNMRTVIHNHAQNNNSNKAQAAAYALTSQLDVRVNALDLNGYRIPTLSLSVTPKISQDQLTLDILADTDASNQLNGKIIIPHVSQVNLDTAILNGNINLNIANVNTLISRIPNVNLLSGRIVGHANLSKRVVKPKFAIELSLENGALTLPKFKTHISKMQLSAHYQSGQAITLMGRANVGNGIANIDSRIEIEKNNLPITLTLTGDQLRVANSNEYQITASPKLHINYSQAALTVDGTIAIPTATIKPEDLSSTVTLPSEVIFVNQPPKTSFLPKAMSMQVEIDLGQAVHVSYQQLSATLRGKLMLSERPNSLLTASGELYTVDGMYKAYGKSLTIQRGRIIYTGNPLSNPGLDIRAATFIKTIGFSSDPTSIASSSASYSGTDQMTVGVWVQGTLNKPNVTLFSDPAGLSQGDILSYLVFGYPQSQASGANALALLQMLPGLNGNNGGGIGSVTDKLQNTLGLSELSVGSTQVMDPTTNSTSSETTVNVTKSLGKNLSLHYSVGLFSAISILNIRYQISKHFAVQSETSTIENGGDLIYEFVKQ